MTPTPERRKTDKVHAAFRRDLVLFGGLLVFLVGLGFYLNDKQRDERIDANATIIESSCLTNNEQDEILAPLVRVSIDPGSSTFGSNIDPADLTTFDKQVIASIAKVQMLAAEGEPTEQELVFRRQWRRLEEETPCADLAQLYRDGGPINELTTTTEEK